MRTMTFFDPHHSPADERLALPGDNLLPAARAQATHHVNIEAPPAVVAALLRPVVGVLHEVMERKQLRGLKQRAEARLAGMRSASSG